MSTAAENRCTPRRGSRRCFRITPIHCSRRAAETALERRGFAWQRSTRRWMQVLCRSRSAAGMRRRGGRRSSKPRLVADFVAAVTGERADRSAQQRAAHPRTHSGSTPAHRRMRVPPRAGRAGRPVACGRGDDWKRTLAGVYDMVTADGMQGEGASRDADRHRGFTDVGLDTRRVARLPGRRRQRAGARRRTTRRFGFVTAYEYRYRASGQSANGDAPGHSQARITPEREARR